MHELCETSGQMWLYRVFDEDRCFVCSKIFYIPLLFVNLLVFLFQYVKQIHGCKEGDLVCCLQIWDNPQGFLVKSLLAFIFYLNENTCGSVHKTSILIIIMKMYFTKKNQ